VAISRSPRSPAARAELARTVTALADGAAAAVLHLPTVRGLDERIRADGRVPVALGRRVAAAVTAVADRSDTPGRTDGALPSPVAPGSLGALVEEGA
jgi:hypothetical protein